MAELPGGRDGTASARLSGSLPSPRAAPGGPGTDVFGHRGEVTAERILWQDICAEAVAIFLFPFALSVRGAGEGVKGQRPEKKLPDSAFPKLNP